MKYLLSIVVPTKDRYSHLKHLINLIEGFGLEEIELIIQDNTFDNSEILSFLEGKTFAGLKYFHSSTQLPILENVDRAILNSTGEYVCFIGDDDGVFPNIVDCVKWMKRNQIDALRPAITVFNWPDFFGSEKKDGGELYYDNFTSDVECIRPLDSLRQMAGRGFPHIYTIPKVYQGIVKRSCLDEIYKVGETFSPGPSPDMATAVALSFVVKKFVSIQIPVIIVGQSDGVGGGERKLKGKVKDIEQVSFLPKNAKENWEKRIPKVWCTQTVWPESAVKSIRYMNSEYVNHVDFECILARFIHTHSSEYKTGFSLSKNWFKLISYLVYLRLNGALYRVKQKLNSFYGRQVASEGRRNRVGSMRDIEAVVKYIKAGYVEYSGADVFDNLKL